MSSNLTATQLFITTLVIAFGTTLTRFLPFLIFRRGQEAPAYVKKLQVLLPPAAIGLLVVYTLEDVSFTNGSRGIPEFLSIGGIVIIHRLFKNTLLSIAGGTLLYMFLIQTMFSV